MQIRFLKRALAQVRNRICMSCKIYPEVQTMLFLRKVRKTSKVLNYILDQGEKTGGKRICAVGGPMADDAPLLVALFRV